MRRRPHPPRHPAARPPRDRHPAGRPPADRQPPDRGAGSARGSRSAAGDDAAFARRLAALRGDYQRIAPDPAFVARVHERITLLTPPLRARRLRRAVGFAASVLVAFLAGFFGAGGGMFLGRGGVNPIERVHALSSGGGSLLPGAPSPGAAPVKPPDARSPADRLRALLAPLGTPAALEPATISAWKKATRDPDPTLRAVARALLRASESPLDAEPRPPPGSALIDLEVPDEPPVGDKVPVAEPSIPPGDATPPLPEGTARDPAHAPEPRPSRPRKPPRPAGAPR